MTLELPGADTLYGEIVFVCDPFGADLVVTSGRL